jgi:hygromycin-B 4-O-kinase
MIMNVDTAQAFLREHFDPDSSDVVYVGAGAWSQCFGFRRGAQELVVRFGRHLDDFEKDQRAAAYRAPELPIPHVLALGPAFDGYYAVSTRVHGVPLEHVGAAQWAALVPPLAGVLEGLRTADLAHTTGWGGWGASGNAPFQRWSERLLAVRDDTPDQRTHGWRARLAAFPRADAVFSRGFELLTRVVRDDVPRGLIHADLINRNVLVAGSAINGVFDWGCSCYGDHLYDLAWFEFWSPWYPELSLAVLREELEHRWHAAGYRPHNRSERLLACLLHIGLDHLAYNAFRGDEPALMDVVERMQALIPPGP